MLPFRIRPATERDCNALLRLEEATFTTDRLSLRAIRHAVRSPAQAVLVAVDDGGKVLGAAIIGFRTGSTIARLSSIAVAASAMGRGLGKALLQEACHAALQRNVRAIRLEVRADNKKAAALYERSGYRQIGVYADYYEDGADALRFEKIIAPLAALE